MDCATSPSPATAAVLRTLALVGHPNVGKSVLFHRLTGTYVTVSNYPGTTVEVSRATPRFDREASLLDTPGVLALPSRSDDERATMRALLNEDMRTLIQVGDAKNLRRTLNLTALLAELGVPMVMALNMTDEAKARGVTVDDAALAAALGVPVVATVATGGEGVAALTDAIGKATAPAPLLRYDPVLERDIARVEARIAADCPHPRLAARGLAILAIGRDPEVDAWLAAQANSAAVRALLAELTAATGRDSLPARLARERGGAAEALARTVTRQAAGKDHTLSMLLGRVAVHRVGGWPMLLGVLYLVYLFVGDFGASTLVGLLEEDFFGEVLNPAVTDFVTSHISTPWLADLIVGEYGLWTMGRISASA